MKDIYPAADQVYVWLGESDPGVDRGMTYLSNTGLLAYFFVAGQPDGEELPKPRVWAATGRAFFIFTDYRRQIFLFCKYFVLLSLSWQKLMTIVVDLSKLWRTLIFLYKVLRLRNDAGVSHGDLNSLLTHEWVERIWTYQEIILATHPIMVSGVHHVPWPQFSYAMMFLHYIAHGFGAEDPITSITGTWIKLLVTKCHVEASAKPSDIDRRSRYEDFSEQVAGKLTIMIWSSMVIIVIVGGLIVAGIATFFSLSNANLGGVTPEARNPTSQHTSAAVGSGTEHSFRRHRLVILWVVGIILRSYGYCV